MDSADSLSFDGGDSDVASFSPSGVPGVSDDVVVLSVFVSVSNGGDGVIKLGSTLSGVDDSTLVVHEDVLVGLDDDGDGSLADGSLELGNAVGLNLVVVGDSDLAHSGLISALTVLGVVRVVHSLLLGVSTEVLEGFVGSSSLASPGVDGLAVHELHLRELHQLSGGNLVMSFDGGGGSESPA